MWFKIIDKLTDALVKSMFRVEKVKTDTVVFRLHYKLSIWLVAIYSIIYTFFTPSKPIICMSGSKSINIQAVTDYCWAHGTYTITKWDPGYTMLSYPGIGTEKPDSQTEYHQYYKWMYIYIFFLLLLLLLPRKVWYTIENGKMKQLVHNLDKVLPFGEPKTVDRQKNMLINYLSANMGYNWRYAYGYVFSEVLNVVVTTASLLIWDNITGNEFSRHGAPSWGTFEPNVKHRNDRLALIFPYVGKCKFNTYGPSGNIQDHDIYCLLTLNVVNERAAIFFWYYFIVLIPIGILAVLFRIALIFSTRLRIILLSGLTPLTSRNDINLLSKYCSYSDWFVIYQMGKSIEPVMFRLILNGLIKKLRGCSIADIESQEDE